MNNLKIIIQPDKATAEGTVNGRAVRCSIEDTDPIIAAGELMVKLAERHGPIVANVTLEHHKAYCECGDDYDPGKVNHDVLNCCGDCYENVNQFEQDLDETKQMARATA